MRLLTQLPPPRMPVPIRYEQWLENIKDQPNDCELCDNARETECIECHGRGETECCECDLVHPCNECKTTGKIACECIGDTSERGYIEQIAHDYKNLMLRKNFIMPDIEIERLARTYAQF